MGSKIFTAMAALMARLTGRRKDEDPTLGLPDYGDTQPHLHRIMPSAPRRWPFESHAAYCARLARFYSDPQ